MLMAHEDRTFLGSFIEQKIAEKIAFCEIDPQTHHSYAETILKRKEAAKLPTQIKFKKNTTNKKGIVPTNCAQKLTKFFGVK
jgi:hypothetical protein